MVEIEDKLQIFEFQQRKSKLIFSLVNAVIPNVGDYERNHNLKSFGVTILKGNPVDIKSNLQRSVHLRVFSKSKIICFFKMLHAILKECRGVNSLLWSTWPEQIKRKSKEQQTYEYEANFWVV